MGLRNSAQSFQKMLNWVLDGLDNVFCYLDDILIFSENEEAHFKTIEELFRRLQDNGLTINIKKCNFAQPQLTFLGYTVNGQGIKPVVKKLEAIVKSQCVPMMMSMSNTITGIGLLCTRTSMASCKSMALHVPENKSKMY